MPKLLPILALAGALSVPGAHAGVGASATDGEPVMITAPMGTGPLDAVIARSRRAAKKRRVARRERDAAAARVPPYLRAIAACESGGNPRAVSANGTYRGKYQFSTSTWAAVGGAGDPAAASEAEHVTPTLRSGTRAGLRPPTG